MTSLSNAPIVASIADHSCSHLEVGRSSPCFGFHPFVLHIKAPGRQLKASQTEGECASPVVLLKQLFSVVYPPACLPCCAGPLKAKAGRGCALFHLCEWWAIWAWPSGRVCMCVRVLRPSWWRRGWACLQLLRSGAPCSLPLLLPPPLPVYVYKPL